MKAKKLAHGVGDPSDGLHGAHLKEYTGMLLFQNWFYFVLG